MGTCESVNNKSGFSQDKEKESLNDSHNNEFSKNESKQAKIEEELKKKNAELEIYKVQNQDLKNEIEDLKNKNLKLEVYKIHKIKDKKDLETMKEKNKELEILKKQLKETIEEFKKKLNEQFDEASKELKSIKREKNELNNKLAVIIEKKKQLENEKRKDKN